MANEDRETLIKAFLARAGWGDAVRAPLAGDASTRSYDRLQGPKVRAVLMNAPPGEEAPACPPDADEATRRALGYNALARLAGPDPRPFVAIAEFLNAHGFSAPEILEADCDNGLLLIEDLGDGVYNRAIAGGADEAPLYEAAIDALAALHELSAPNALPLRRGGTVPLLTYDDVALGEEVRLLTDWYLPACTGEPVDPVIEDEFFTLWRAALQKLPSPHEVLILRDYHADNLLWLPDREGIARVGLLDFQDGLRGHRAYDLVSLLEDARRDVAPALAETMLARYTAHALAANPDFNLEAFQLGYAVLGLQRNTKILGIFARLWKRDGKPQYPSYMPRIWDYVAGDLAHPALNDLKAWYDKHIPSKWRGDFLARKARGGKA